MARSARGRTKPSPPHPLGRIPPFVCALAGWVLAWAVLLGPATWAKAQPAARIEPSVGLGAILVWPFGHAELRYWPSPTTSIATFLSATPFSLQLFGQSVDVWWVNAGMEGRYHFLPGSVYDPHVGAGGGMLMVASGPSAESVPWVWGNAGVTFGLGPRLRLDLEVSPVVFAAGSVLPGGQFPVLPFARLRWIF